MSITHVVLFRFREPDEAAQAVERLRSLLGKVPQLRRLEAGLNQVPSERAYDVGLVTSFDSLEDLQAYVDHPDHVEVATWIRARAAGAASADFTPEP